MSQYRVRINHQAGHLIVRTVEAPNKRVAEATVRADYPSVVLGRTSSIVKVA